jgi:hypothetical protein
VEQDDGAGVQPRLDVCDHITRAGRGIPSLTTMRAETGQAALN